MTDEVTREIELPASPEDVWGSLTDSELLSQWLADHARLDLEPGGDLALRTREGEMCSGWIEEVDPPRRLVFWWTGDGESEESTRVEWDLERTARGTLLRVTESRPLAVLGSSSPGPQMVAVG